MSSTRQSRSSTSPTPAPSRHSQTALMAMRRGAFDRAERALDEAAGLGAIGGPGALGGWLELARVELAWLRSDAPDAGRPWAGGHPVRAGCVGRGCWRVGGALARAPWPGRASSACRCRPRAPSRPQAPRAALVADVEAAPSHHPPDAARWGGRPPQGMPPGRTAVGGGVGATRTRRRRTSAVRDAAAGRAALESVVATADAIRVSRRCAPAPRRLPRRARIRLFLSRQPGPSRALSDGPRIASARSSSSSPRG